MTKYIIPKGRIVYLFRSPAPYYVPLQEGLSMISEKEIEYLDVDIIVPSGISERALNHYLYFALPENNKRYTVLAVSVRDVVKTK